MGKEPIYERGWFNWTYILVLMFGGPALYCLGMECVLRWVFGIVGLFNVFFRIVSAASLVLLIVLIFQLIGRGLK
jgi:hypothetical protein